MNLFIQRVIAVFLAVLVPAMSFAATGGAIVRSSAGVSVNSIPAISGLAVFDGDTVQTTKTSPATLSSDGNLIQLGADSELRYSQTEMQLERGTAVISTRKRLASRIDEISIRPTQDTSRYEVIRNADAVIVKAREGTVEVADASGSILVNPGMAATIVPQAPTVASTSNSHQRQTESKASDQQQAERKRRGGAPIPASTAGAQAGVSHAKLYAILGAVGAGAFTAAVITSRGERPCMSPDMPTSNSQNSNNCQ